jgi:hypothetical protein
MVHNQTPALWPSVSTEPLLTDSSPALLYEAKYTRLFLRKVEQNSCNSYDGTQRVSWNTSRPLTGSPNPMKRTLQQPPNQNPRLCLWRKGNRLGHCLQQNEELQRLQKFASVRSQLPVPVTFLGPSLRGLRGEWWWLLEGCARAPLWSTGNVQHKLYRE